MSRVLILPGDVRFNLGDTAICLGVISMIRAIDPVARVVVWGSRPIYPGGFEGVRFLESPGPELWREARRCDAVLWGGGQLLQSNRSRVKLPYWAARIAAVRFAGAPVIGMAQGVGPLLSAADRRLAGNVIRTTQFFTVRDEESRRLVESCGVEPERVAVTADPALLFDPPRAGAVREERGAPAIGLSVRYTGHHRPGRIVPFQLLPEAARRRALDGPGFRTFRDRVVALADRVLSEIDADLVLVPMYHSPWETDEILAKAIAGGVRETDRVTIFRPERSLGELTACLRRLDAFVGTPMHATILATSQGVPTLAVPYEPKGIEYMRRLGMDDWVAPLSDMDGDTGFAALGSRIRDLWHARGTVRERLAVAVPELREHAAATSDPVRELLGRAPRVAAVPAEVA